MTTLPTLHGRALDGQAATLPQDLPPMILALVIGLSHEARHDVNQWKRVLDAAGIPWLSLAVSPEEIPVEAMAPIVEAMRARLPESMWSHIVQVHGGGPGLISAFGWKVDDAAKVLLVEGDGTVLFAHGGPFSPEAEQALIERF